MATDISCKQELEAVQMARTGILQAMSWVQGSLTLHGSDINSGILNGALADCGKLYDESQARLARLLSGESHDCNDARTWLSGAFASHRTCLDGLEENGLVEPQVGAQNLTMLLREALALYVKGRGTGTGVGTGTGTGVPRTPKSNQTEGLLTSWNATTSKADLVVAKDGTGTHTTISDAVAALAKMGRRRPKRVIIYVKSGVYVEQVEIRMGMKNVIFIGDGIDRTIVTANQNVLEGSSTTFGSATFGVSGDRFWARDMTFENTAGPEKHQAVALRVSSDHSLFYRCSFKGFQDTLFVHSQRQFYRDCQIYGTIDFIFGDAAVVFQNCDIFVKRPMRDQANMITAQGRDDPNANTGISIQGSRVLPAPEFSAVKGMFKSYLGRPWGKYSRTVLLKTDLDGLIDPKGWTEWSGNFALSTLFYGEYMNSGTGASTEKRVEWPGFHVLTDPQDTSPFTVKNFIQGESWILASGVPFSPGI
ncbi:hypothetical protein L1049_019080 [Liquidambar formosana]|uniref:Pectinesterase n=1 Tax=Liquidambar formosana TaxID=63359 RepID=A0AAP0RAZ6_LIQFO